MRISKALIKRGVSAAWQHTIYGALVRDRSGKATPEEHDKIRRMCVDIGDVYKDGLYRFLTDPTVNHDYIRLYYGVPKGKLFTMKRDFYIKWLKD